MSYSETKIVNIALTELGEDCILSVDDANERARRSKMLFGISRDYVLSRGNWSFARKTSRLTQAAGEEHPVGVVFVYPSDCLEPRKVVVRGSHPTPWFVEGDFIIVPVINTSSASTEYLYLQYTKFATNTDKFTIPFLQAVGADLAARMAWAFTGSNSTAREKRGLAEILIDEMLTIDANRGSWYREKDEDPDNDRFINPAAGSKVYYASEDT